MTAKEDDGFRSTKYQHDLISIGATESITFHMGSGTDTATNRYMNSGAIMAYGVRVMPTNVISITHINGVPQKVAIPVGTNGWSSKNTQIQNITLKAGAADVTSVEMRG